MIKEVEMFYKHELEACFVFTLNVNIIFFESKMLFIPAPAPSEWNSLTQSTVWDDILSTLVRILNLPS